MNAIPQEMMNCIPAMIYSWQIEDGKSTLLHVSDYCQDLLGVSPQDALQDANRIIGLILPADASTFSAATTVSNREGTVFDCRVRMRTGSTRPNTDGVPITVHFKSRPRRQGTATIWDGVAMEVASSSRSRSSSSSSNDAMVEDSIRLPQHEQPKVAAAKQLVNAERNLTEWLSHEIRNPLSVTMEALQTLQELHGHCDHVQDNYSEGECYQVISESIRYVEDLLNNMNDLDQCDQGRMPVVTAPCTVREDILLPTYRMMKRLKPHDGPVQLRMAPGASANEEQVIAHVDKLRLRQVLTNLIANSFHFTTQGFVEVDLRTKEDPPRMLSFHVRDSGCGVKPSQYDTLFSRWEELGTSRNGTGIGLCLCQALVKAMGGSIRLNTDYHSGVEGHPGAEFVVEVPLDSTGSKVTPKSGGSSPTQGLPDVSLSSALFATHKIGLKEPTLNLQQPSTLAMSTPTAPASTSPTHSQGSECCNPQSSSSSSLDAAAAVAMSPVTVVKTERKVTYFKGKYQFLIVDDEKMGRKFLRRRISRLFPDATVTEVASGEEALVKAATTQYDVITMDHFMAVEDMVGDETIRQLRTNLKSDALILGISGNDKRAEHMDAGADSFFQKPLPGDSALIEHMQEKLAPPGGWNVLILSNDKGVSTLLKERLYQVSSPHFTTREQAQKRWNIVAQSPTSTEEVIERLTTESFDLVILADAQRASEAGARIRKHLRHMPNSDDLVVIECAEVKAGDPSGLEWDLMALPSNKQMRETLCKSLLSVRTVTSKSSSAGPSTPVLATGLPPKRSNSGAATMA